MPPPEIQEAADEANGGCERLRRWTLRALRRRSRSRRDRDRAADIERKTPLREFDKDVAKETEQRKDDQSEYIDEATSNQAAVGLLGMIKNRSTPGPSMA